MYCIFETNQNKFFKNPMGEKKLKKKIEEIVNQIPRWIPATNNKIAKMQFYVYFKNWTLSNKILRENHKE